MQGIQAQIRYHIFRMFIKMWKKRKAAKALAKAKKNNKLNFKHY